jgi:PAS domain-containing protein
MERVLEASPSGFLTLDLDERIASVNPAAERLLREPREGLVGRRLEETAGPHTRRLAALGSASPGSSRWAAADG